MHAYTVLNQIKETSGKKDKEAILKENIDNHDLKEILKFSFDPLIATGLSSKKMKKNVACVPLVELNSIHDLMAHLKQNNTGTDQVIADVQTFIQNQPEEHQDLIHKIATKTLKIGCDDKTMNKVFGKSFIPVHEVQQAYPQEKHQLKPNEWFSLSQKLNGIRGSYLGDVGLIKSRQGQEISGMNHIIEAIKEAGLSDYFVDGELVRHNDGSISDNENFRKTCSIVSADDHQDNDSLDFVIFDFFPISEFIEGESRDSYRVRLEQLKSLKDKLPAESPLKVVDIFYQGTDTAMISHYLKQMDEQGKEGLMLNRDVPYKCKRHNGILKVKSFKHCDVICTGIENGKDGRFEHTLGSIIVDYKGNPCGVTGFTDEERELYYNNPDLIIGKIVQVKYKEESQNRDGKLSMQFPTFEAIRHDKKEPSYN